MERRLKRKVIISLYLVCSIMFCIGLIFVEKSFNIKPKDFTSVSNPVIKKEVPVTKVESVIIKPYNDINVKVLNSFYDYKADSDSQQKSILFYNNTYMPNTGVIYGSENVFDVLCIYDGEVISVKASSLLGNVVEIKHSNNIISTYQLLDDVTVNKGDTIKQGTKIGTSSKSDIINDDNYKLYFEVSIDGELVDGEKIYDKKLAEL